MPTAVLDLDLANLPSVIPIAQHYNKAFLLLRYKGMPLGKTTVPVIDGRLHMHELQQTILDAVSATFWNSWLHDYLQWNERMVAGFEPLTATIAICSRDRTEDLKRCLDALMTLPDDGQEIIVVDNSPSSNSTELLVKQYPGVRYILESRPGLNIARNRAMQEARHDIVAFIDDDALPDVNWLRALVVNFNSPIVACVTGMTMPLELETEAQEAFERYSPFGKGFKRRTFTLQTHNPLATGQVGAGANMAFRRSLFHKIGRFDEALDAGTPTQSGGDHEYFLRILTSGYSITYDPAALSWHRHRRTWPETKRAIYGYGVGVYAFWTRTLLVQKEWEIIKLPWRWFIYEQSKGLLRSIFNRPNAQPLALVWAELRGCMRGPFAYIKSRNQLANKIITY